MFFKRLTGFFLLLIMFTCAAMAQVRSPLPLVRGAITTRNLASTGSCTAGSCVCIDASTVGSMTVQTGGTYTASGGLSVIVSNDWTNWSTLTGSSTFTRLSSNSPSATIASGQADVYQISGVVTGTRAVCVTALGAVTGSAAIIISPAEPSIGSAASGGGGGAATVADGADAAQGTTSDAACASDTATCTLIALTKRLNQNVNSTNLQLPSALGQTTAAGSVSFVPASDATPTVPQNSTTSGQLGNLIQCATTTGAPTYTTGKTNPCSTDTAGNIRVVGVFSNTSAGPLTPATATATNSTIAGATYNSTPPTWGNTQQGSLQVDELGNLRSIEPDSKSITADTCASSCSSRNYFAVDMSGYESVRFHISALAGTVTVQTSEDSTTGSDGTWVAASCLITSAASATAVMTTTPSAGGWVCPKYLKWMRLAQTSYSSGTTTTLGGHLSKTPFFGHVTIGNSSLSIIGNNSENSAPVLAPVPISVEVRSTNKTAGTSGNTMRPIGTLVGVMVQRPWSIPELELTGAAGSGGVSNSTADQTLASAAAAGIRNYLTQFDLMCEALGTASEITIRDGSGGTVLWRTKVGTAGLPFMTVSFPNPKKTTAATALIWKMETASGTGACFGNGSVFQAP